jgi:hypothetical protein
MEERRGRGREEGEGRREKKKEEGGGKMRWATRLHAGWEPRAMLGNLPWRTHPGGHTLEDMPSMMASQLAVGRTVDG